jgi:ABC-type enterobactin transport system permease subunit
MSTVTLIIILLGLAATALFIAGFARGLRQSISGRDAASDTGAPEDSNHWPSVIFAVIASAAVIAAVGFIPAAIYAGPFLVILTAAANGLAFFLDDGYEPAARR